MAFKKCTAGVAWSKGRQNLKSVRLTVQEKQSFTPVLTCSNLVKTFHTCSLNLDTLSSCRSFHLSHLSYKIEHNVAPKHLLDICFKPRTQHYNLRHMQSFDLRIPRTQLFLASPLFKSSTVSDSQPPSVKILNSFSAFQKKAAQHILSTHCECSTYPYYY